MKIDEDETFSATTDLSLRSQGSLLSIRVFQKSLYMISANYTYHYKCTIISSLM